MRHLISILTCLTLLGSITYAQDDSTDISYYSRNWINHQFIDYTNDVTRSIAYNKTTDHVLVATRKGSARVIVLDAANGDSLGTLIAPEGGYSGGVYPLNMVAVSDEGTIYLSNLCAPQYSPSDVVKIYRYSDENAEAEVVFEDALDGIRYGDAMACISGTGETFVYIGGMGTDAMAILRDTGAATLEDWGTMNLPLLGNARHGISPMDPGGRVWVNGVDSSYPPPTLLSGGGDIIAVVPDSLISAGGSGAITHMKLGDYNIVSVVNPYGGTIRSARFFEDELGGITFDYFGGNSDSSDLDYLTGYMTDVNGSSAIAYDSERNALITLIGVNSIASLSLEPMLKTSTPREGILEISVDGQNDFFPTDLLGDSEGHELYMTWSEGKVFFGLTGDETLIDPNTNRQFHLALDLDPNGDQGSNLAPISGTGTSGYPFSADVVYVVDSWEEADFLAGTIYKWNGSSWDGTAFEDFAASTGALAWADDIFELAAIKNEPGLGENFEALAFCAYLSDPSGGALLAAYPPENMTSTGTSLGAFYVLDSLGTNMFPTNPAHVRTDLGITSVNDDFAVMPVDFKIEAAYPNPFNPSTNINFELSEMAIVHVSVFDLRGAELMRIDQGQIEGGSHSILLDLSSQASGVYIYRFEVDGVMRSSAKLLLLK